MVEDPGAGGRRGLRGAGVAVEGAVGCAPRGRACGGPPPLGVAEGDYWKVPAKLAEELAPETGLKDSLTVSLSLR